MRTQHTDYLHRPVLLDGKGRKPTQREDFCKCASIASQATEKLLDIPWLRWLPAITLLQQIQLAAASPSDTSPFADVYSVRGARAEVFKGVLKVHIADGDDYGVPVIAPVKAALLQPLEVGGVPDLLAHQILCTHTHESITEQSFKMHKHM